jgi:putative DNA primase/helicase
MFSSRPVVDAGFDDGQPQGRVVLSLPGAGLHLRPALQVATPRMSTLFHPDQIRRYFESRLPAFHFNGRAQVSTRCPFHDDGTASFSLNVDEGLWKCHAGCGKGGVFDFEEKFSACDRERAKAAVGELLEMSFGPELEPPEATYLYQDEHHRLVFRKLRHRTPDGGKTFVCEAPAENGRGWVKNLTGIRTKPLYHLPELIRSTYAIVVEGEKDADRLTAINLSQFDPDGLPVAVTTNFDGADHWRAEYNPFFAGKIVTIFPDNDVPGEKHALAVARGIHPFAAGVKICRLPGLPEKGDVSDYLDAGHTAEELIAEIAKTREWLPARVSQFKHIADIMAQGAEKADWIVPYYVERSAITSLSGKIKYGKTSFILSACKAILTGGNFLGQSTTRGSIVMVTEQSGHSFVAAAERAGLESCEGLWVMQPHAAFGLSWPQIVDAAVMECRRVSATLLIIDTLNSLAALEDENNASQVLEAMRPLQQACGQGWGIWISVHERKSGGEVSDAARGSSAAGGVADVLMSLRKPEGNHNSETLRKIAAIGRFSETPTELVVDWTLDGEYVVIGNSEAATRDRATTKILDALPFFVDQAKTVLVLREETGESQTTIRRILRELKAARSGTGPKGDPFKYHRHENGGAE